MPGFGVDVRKVRRDESHDALAASVKSVGEGNVSASRDRRVDLLKRVSALLSQPVTTAQR
jgi:hypothetical protein